MPDADVLTLYNGWQSLEMAGYRWHSLAQVITRINRINRNERASQDWIRDSNGARMQSWSHMEPCRGP